MMDGSKKTIAMIFQMYEVAMVGNDEGLESGDKLWGREQELSTDLKTKQWDPKLF